MHGRGLAGNGSAFRRKFRAFGALLPEFESNKCQMNNCSMSSGEKYSTEYSK
jgi:hypothetical protein